MKYDFTSLESGPLLYFLLHSGVFVAGLGLVFFLLGLWFGALIWGRFRRQNQRLMEEGNELREEMAGLKRKLAEQAVRPATGVLPAAAPAALLTEVLPSVSEVFPERTAAKPAPVETHLTIPSIPDMPESLLPEEGFLKDAPILRSRLRLRALQNQAVAAPEVTEEAVEPFSFLLDEEPVETEDETSAQEADDEPPFSPLSFILDEESSAVTDPVSLPSVIPEQDPVLGLIFKEPPADVDDLTRIQGISPGLQHRLQELGIYKLQQIAAWNTPQVREFSHRLAFKDRIEREQWTVQAQRLMTGELV
ncbi:MAG: hypothetical protein V4672_20715 [Verrucomicrobiota bacterium]